MAARSNYANSLIREDPDKSHILLGGSGRPWVLGTPYPSQGEVERAIGKPPLVDSTGARICFISRCRGLTGPGATIDGDSSKMLELWFDQSDSKLSLMTVHKDGEETVGRTGRDYKKHWTYFGANRTLVKQVNLKRFDVMTRPAFLRQFGELTAEDFIQHPVWIAVHGVDDQEPWYDDERLRRRNFSALTGASL